MTAEFGRVSRRYVNPCTKVLRNPTSDPMRRAASSASTPTRLPLVGSIASLRVSRITEDATLESRTCGNNRSISGCAAKFDLMFRSFVRSMP